MASLVDRFILRFSRLPTEFDPDYLEMLRMSKYRVMGVPDVQPGKCANCGASKADGRTYIDINIDIAFYGAVFLCSHCLKEVATAVGLFDSLKDIINKLTDRVNAKEALFDQGESIRRTFENSVGEVKEYFDNLSTHWSSDLTNPGTGLESYDEPEPEAVGEGDQPITKSESRVTKSATGSRSKDLLSLAERLQAKS